MTEQAVLSLIEKKVQEAGSARKLAFRLNVDPATICKIRKGEFKPGRKTLEALGLKRVNESRIVEVK